MYKCPDLLYLSGCIIFMKVKRGNDSEVWANASKIPDQHKKVTKLKEKE